MDARKAQIYHWIQTGKHIIRTEYEKASSDRTGTKPSDAEQSEIEASDDNTSTVSSTSSSMTDKFVGADHDVLIPTATEIDRVFQEGRETWMQFVKSAESLPQNSIPTGLRDPSIMLKDVPALPKALPRNGVLIGQPLWHIPSGEYDQGDNCQSKDWDPEHVYGAQKHYWLSYPTAIECHSSSKPDFFHYGSSAPPDGQNTSDHPRALLILTLCWSYILSARFWELQRKTPSYSAHVLRPKVAKTATLNGDYSNIHLGAFASRDLVKWLCAILAPQPGWSAQGGGFAPWTAFCPGDVRFVISTDEPVIFSENEQAPGSDRAAELLIELCSLYGLGPTERKSKKSEFLAPYTAAFLAALALPFYRYIDLQPQFPPPSLRRRRIRSAALDPIRQYVSDLPYYMTLSMHPRSVGSVIWSIFWQPEVQCNLVSPWLTSVLSVLKPIMDAGSLDMIAKIFAFRRPRVALWWQGILICGNRDILDLISRYLETLNERYGYGSMGFSDIAVSVWTGSPQSFLDEETSQTYPKLKEMVSRADLLRHRYNLRLQDTASFPPSWKPFGFVSKDAVEVDIWPWLEYGHARKYVHWVWWIKKERGGHCPDIQHGFRKDTGRFTSDVPDRLDIIQADKPVKYNDAIKSGPSRESTLRMLSYCMEDVSGDRDTDILVVPGATVHPWLKGWRGLE